MNKSRENVNSGTSTAIDFDRNIDEAESDVDFNDNGDSGNDNDEPFDLKAFETELSQFDDDNGNAENDAGSDIDEQALGANWLPSAPTSALKGNTDIRATMNNSYSSGNVDEYMSKLSKLEVEFHDLDQQYHRILNGVELPSPAHGTSTSSSIKNPSESASDLVDVIRKLHEKSHELREIRSSPLRFE